jgi:UDP-glucose 4-epimerase
VVPSDKGPSEAYNICNGEGLSIGNLVEAFRAESKVPIALEPDPKFTRPIDEMVRIGEARKFMPWDGDRN